MCVSPPPPAKPSPTRRGSAQHLPATLSNLPACFATACHLQVYSRPTCPVAACCNFFSRLTTLFWPLWFCTTPPKFMFLLLRIATFGSPANHLPASFTTARHLPVSDGRTCPAFYTGSLKTKLPTLHAPPCQSPFHGFHTTNCYLCFCTAPLPNSVETAVCHLWFRNTLPARPCQNLALPPLVTQAIPAHTMSRLRRVNCCVQLWFYKALPAKLCQAFLKGSAAPGRQPIYIYIYIHIYAQRLVPL